MEYMIICRELKINIPNASVVPAGSYTGTIDWNLTIAPNP